MYNNNFEKYLTQEKPRKQFKNSSFSSVLLDQVFRSIDKDNNQVLKNINNVKCSSFSDNDSISFSTTSRSSSSDFSFSSVHSFSSAEYSSVAYKSSKPITRTKVCCYHNNSNSNNNIQSKNTENSMIKSKSRAMKIYSNLKKIKQPISPCGRLSSFINTLFRSENSKKMKTKNDKPLSSTPSLPRSCLSKNGGINFVEKRDDIKRRNVRFHPVSTMILDDDSYPSGYRLNVEVRGCHKLKKCDEFVMKMRNVDNYVDDEERFSDCSEDLFEIDHFGLLGKDRFCDELPVYGTTHMNRSCIIR